MHCSRYFSKTTIVLIFVSLLHVSNTQQEYENIRLDWGQIKQITSKSNPNIVQFLWTVDHFWDLVDDQQDLVLSPRFYVTHPGYRLQMMLIPNTTYSDNMGYAGIFFRIVTGNYDALIEWPYKLKTVLTAMSHNVSDWNELNSNGLNSNGLNSNELKQNAFTVIPNTDPCRLRSAFLRPSADNDNTPRPDGCGNRRHISLIFLDENRDQFVYNNTLLIKLSVHLRDFGQTHKKAIMAMKYNQLVSNFEWTIDGYPRIENESISKENIVVLTSEPFYTHSNGYLMQIFMTLLPKKKAFAISIALAQGDHDRYLQWPFPYKFEVAIVDQSPGYWKRDYSVGIHPSTSECGTEPFFQPGSYPDFCFITVQSMELLSLTHYNFIVNDTLKIRFTTKFERYSMRKRASLIIDDKKLISEYNWLVPAIDAKIDKYDFNYEKPKLLASEEFYTNGQGYLAQIILTVNHSDDNQITMGLELAIIEGEYDGVLEWPFNKTFELSIVKQRINENIFGGESGNTSNESDIKTVIVPSASNCSRHSFQRPIERNPPCGQKQLINFGRISRSREYLKLGNLHIKARIYLNHI